MVARPFLVPDVPGAKRPWGLIARKIYFLAMGTEARVLSQSMFMVPPLADLSKEIVKFSTGAGKLDTFMPTRAKSFEGPG